ncbi:hypothetical protein D6855_12370 [Butyrivibrio sp. CB08]|uniref:hypothetical protein n=1 Tax=Butyrivibrio sp. CB08 TaxID=2364879 RepID=UPI000EAAC19F|nr:hypothetical protein [Butyrivibrio sp. CB08]RKM57838.1 hypothetical protein D6855_12370 [Butyrivibrio sp. CB08]
MYGIFMECWVALKLYFGNPILPIILFVSAVYLLVCEKDIRKNIILGILPIVILAGFLLPITKIVYVAAFDDGSDTYYRVLWLIPMYVVIGYAACKLIFGFESKVKQRVALVAAVVIVMLSGSLVYFNQYMSVAENMYHIPQEVIDVCDVIAPKDGDSRVRAVFPSELVHFVRQYDVNILMPYGREMLATQWDYYNAVYDAYEKPEVINAEKLLEATRQSKCLYIVLRTDRKVDVSLVTMGLKLVDTVGDYIIYSDPEVQTWYEEQGVYVLTP